MQLFPCPFCGERDEREFHFVGEAGKRRPDTKTLVTDKLWAGYLHVRQNPKGPSREVWRHLTCNELFVMERDTLSMEVLAITVLRKDAAP